MSKNKDPAVLFYTSDFLAGTLLMNYEQKGKYITLLCLQRENGRLTEEDMLSVCGKRDERIFCKFIQDEEGLYYNVRMEKEAEKRNAFIESRRKSSNARFNNDTSNDISDDIQNDTSYDIRTIHRIGNGNKNININGNLNESLNIPPISPTNSKEKKQNSKEIEKKSNSDSKGDKAKANVIEQRFDSFWEAYPKKKAKEAAKKAWMKLKPSAELFEEIMQAVAEQKKSADWIKDNGQFIPYPSTWLNQGRWSDEVTVDTATEDKPAEVRYSSYDAEDGMNKALERSYGSDEKPKEAASDGADALFLAALKKTYG